MRAKSYINRYLEVESHSQLRQRRPNIDIQTLSTKDLWKGPKLIIAFECYISYADTEAN